jgi:hypothetical protein
MTERGTTEAEIIKTVIDGEQFPAQFGRQGFRRNFNIQGVWRGKPFSTKQIEAYGVFEDGDWLVITVIVKYF